MLTQIRAPYQSTHPRTRDLLNRWHESGVVYCHFKSNFHLKESLSAQTDLDILASRETQSVLREGLVRAGFKFFRSGRLASYVGVEDWLGLDEESGRIAHIHLHFQLITGLTGSKAWTLPLSKAVLENRILDEQHQVFIISPEHELMMFVIRTALKKSVFPLAVSRNSREALHSDLTSEFGWLRQRADTASVVLSAASLFPARVATMVASLVTSPEISNFDLARLRHAINGRSAFFGKRLFAFPWARKTQSVLVAKAKNWGVYPASFLGLTKRGPAAGGFLVAVLGIDGAGKSTITAATARLLANKVDVVTLYFGSGDGPKSSFRRFLQLSRPFFAVCEQIFDGLTKALGKSFTKMTPSCTVFQAFFALSLAFEKKSKMTKASRARANGKIVLCDRFPQQTMPAMNDGPKLQPWLEERSFFGIAARIEHGIFNDLLKTEQDLSVFLEVPPETARNRKPHDIKVLRRKAKALETQIGMSRSEVIRINTNQGIPDTTIREVLSAVWQRL